MIRQTLGALFLAKKCKRPLALFFKSAYSEGRGRAIQRVMATSPVQAKVEVTMVTWTEAVGLNVNWVWL